MKLGLAFAAIVTIVPSIGSAATVEQWRKRPPRWEGQTTVPLDKLLGCLGTRWAGSLSAHMRAMPIENGMSYTNDGLQRDILVDVIDEGERRVVKLWLRNFMGMTAGAKEQIEKLSACTEPSAAR
ncbi:hypothetical protein VHN57_02000 [Sphingobium sp. WW5]|uniref:hypothetical protein n=1 Tax=unclassified Sphingobium TaxID=2611147 RepID=UPI003C189CF7